METVAKQTPLQLATEFIVGLQGVKSGSADMDKLFDAYVSWEKLPAPPQAILDAVSDVNHTGFNMTSVDFIVNCKPQFSYVLLAWLAMQSSAIPACANTLVGILATYFYSTHSRKEKVTLEWLGNVVGKGKLISFQGIFPWYSASKMTDGKSIFEVMKPEDLYIA